MKRTAFSELEVRLKPFCERLARLYEDPMVILCGSAAVGESMPWSDVDLIVIADFEKPFLERLIEMALLDETGLRLEVLGYTPAEFMRMLGSLNPGAIEAVESGIPIMHGPFLSELKRRLLELKKLGLTRTQCTYLLAQETKQ